MDTPHTSVDKIVAGVHAAAVPLSELHDALSRTRRVEEIFRSAGAGNETLRHAGIETAGGGDALERGIGTLGVAHTELAAYTGALCGEPAPALHTQRPGWLAEMITDAYEQEHSAPPHFSLFGANGAESAYDFGPYNTAELAAGMRSALGRPLSVLDVGTGTGIPIAYHRSLGDTVQGVTAFDYRKLNGQHVFKDDDRSYLVANAEELDAIDGLAADFDIVMCCRTAHHLVDVLGAFEQMANRTKPGGLLFVDAFHFTDNEDSCAVTAAHVLEAMRAAGFEPLEGTPVTGKMMAASSLPTVVWRRRADASLPVRLPLVYAKDANGQLTYRLAA